MPSPKVAIVGSGAVGLYHGAKLALGGAEVGFLMRGDLAAVRARGSVIVRDPGGVAELRPVRVFGSSAEIGPVGLAVVALKATVNAELPVLLGPLIGPDTAILTLQNGLGSDEWLADRFGPERVMGGLAFFAGTRTAPGEVTCYHRATLTLGEFGRPATPRARALAGRFAAGGLEAHVAGSLAEARWRKLVWNVPFNGLAIAAGGVTTDRICSDPALAAEARELMAEVRRGAAGLGLAIPEEFLAQQFALTPPMGAYAPSSLIDFRAGRAVEVDAIWGEPLRRAQAAGVALPRLARLHAKLVELTSR